MNIVQNIAHLITVSTCSCKCTWKCYSIHLTIPHYALSLRFIDKIYQLFNHFCKMLLKILSNEDIDTKIIVCNVIC